jgi:hypothetical protein
VIQTNSLRKWKKRYLGIFCSLWLNFVLGQGSRQPLWLWSWNQWPDTTLESIRTAELQLSTPVAESAFYHIPGDSYAQWSLRSTNLLPWLSTLPQNFNSRKGIIIIIIIIITIIIKKTAYGCTHKPQKSEPLEQKPRHWYFIKSNLDYSNRQSGSEVLIWANPSLINREIKGSKVDRSSVWPKAIYLVCGNI